MNYSPVSQIVEGLLFALSAQSPYDQGACAAMLGCTKDENPYDAIARPISRRQWRQGWDDARQGMAYNQCIRHGERP